ncbi:hypothetical protein GS399_05875 [Pedobacter sp. HMF7647]|uniref:WbqC family protein n=1 Tax=Hufsiella arboris TaxID=2695275 RepID=A0A7K1Y7F2_9SPHI|nr:WbqC family protein [Hufsiella arboris]MXV50495.1 hypothetical protein [Hufsiella arboris]
MENAAIVPLFYLPPVSYYTKLIQYKNNLSIEACENFPKQTYRNRAVIQSHNGRLNLIVPVIKGSKSHTKIKDVKISYDFNWQREHWLSLQTCYRTSAFFEFYEDEFSGLYSTRHNFLFDYNLGIFELINKLLKIKLSYDFTIAYEKNYDAAVDLRESIHPKKASAEKHKPYFQVFEDRNGFMPGLSIVDLLFNQGPNSLNYL